MAVQSAPASTHDGPDSLGLGTSRTIDHAFFGGIHEAEAVVGAEVGKPCAFWWFECVAELVQSSAKDRRIHRDNDCLVAGSYAR